MSRSIATSPRQFAVAPTVVADGPGYWKGAATLTIVMMSVVAVRVHEFFPLITVVKPVLTVSIICLMLLLSRTSNEVQRAAFSYPQTKRVIAYIAFAALTVPFALYPGLSFSTARSMLPPVLLFVAFTLLPPRRDVLDRLQRWFVGLVLFFSAYTQFIGRTWAGRLQGAGGSFDSNDLAAIMAMAFPLAAGLLARATPGRDRLLALGAVVVLVLGIIATGSRGGTLALLAGVILFALALRGERGFLVLMVLVVGGILAWNTAPETFRERMRSLTSIEQDYNYTHDTGRKAVWKRGRQYWSENPFIGLGAGNFPVAEGYYLEAQGRTGKWSAAHNAYVQAFAELGTIGGGLFIVILIAAARRMFVLWRPRRNVRERAPPLQRPEFLASLAAFAGAAYFLSYAYFPPLFALLGLIALADRVHTAEAFTRPGAQIGSSQTGPMRIPGQRGGAASLQPADLRIGSPRRRA